MNEKYCLPVRIDAGNGRLSTWDWNDKLRDWSLADQIALELNPTHGTATVVETASGVVVEWEP